MEKMRHYITQAPVIYSASNYNYKPFWIPLWMKADKENSLAVLDTVREKRTKNEDWPSFFNQARPETFRGPGQNLTLQTLCFCLLRVYNTSRIC